MPPRSLPREALGRSADGRIRQARTLFPIAIALALLLSGCTQAEIGRSEWILEDVSADEQELRVAVFSGHSSCMDFERIEVTEDEHQVEIRGYARHDGSDACTDDHVTHAVQVELDAPLGDRALVGCGGDLRFESWDHDPEIDCRRTRP